MADKEYIERMQVLHEIGWLVTQKQGAQNGYFPNRETLTPAEVRDIILNTPAADVVSRNLYEQIKWERDLAMAQLEEHGISFGAKKSFDLAKVVKCKNCTEWNEAEGECSHWYGFRENDFCSYGERKKV